jgi:hypothetical protein
MERRDDEAGRQRGAPTPEAQEREATGPGAPIEADRDARANRIAEREREREAAERGDPTAGRPPPDQADWTI